jgi:hypothetical protein
VRSDYVQRKVTDRYFQNRGVSFVSVTHALCTKTRPRFNRLWSWALLVWPNCAMTLDPLRFVAIASSNALQKRRPEGSEPKPNIG